MAVLDGQLLLTNQRLHTAAGNVALLNEQVLTLKKTVGAATTVTLPPTPTLGRLIRVIDGKGDAGTNAITVVPAAGTINGASSYQIAVNYGAAEFFYTGQEWLASGTATVTGTTPTFAGVTSTGDVKIMSSAPVLWLMDTTAVDTGFLVYGDAGNFNIAAATDAGGAVLNLLNIDRATGAWSIPGTLSVGALSGFTNLLFGVSAAERTAISNYTTTTDHTALINAALATGKRVYAPAGLWNIDTDVGVILPSGFAIVGDGMTRTIFRLAAKGGTLANLQGLVKGSGFRRAFTAGATNPYVLGGLLSDFTVLMRPQTPYNASNYLQIGVDLRHITRSVCERIFVSNATDTQTHPHYIQTVSEADQTQGYGFAIGTKLTPAVDYCGGECNVLRDCHAWGLYKNFVIDDPGLGASAAHATLLDHCEAQGGHELIVQGNQYNAGTVINDATIQNCRRQTGNANPTLGVAICGYNCRATVKYAEMGEACDKLFILASTARRCRGELLYYTSSAPSTATIEDTAIGGKNSLFYPAPVLDTAPTPDVTTGTGDIIDLFNCGYRRVTCKFRWTGAAIEIASGSVGIASVTRAGTGDYTVNLSRPMPTTGWAVAIHHDTTASGWPGTVGIPEPNQSTTAFRFYAWEQANGTTTQIDPRWVFFTGFQV